MKFTYLNAAIVFLFSLTLQTGHSDTGGSYPIGDDMIENSIERQLQFDPSVFSNDVDVSSDEGIVTLTGEVDSLRAKNRAESLAASRKGVLSVINRLKVRRTSTADPELKANADTALQLDTVTNELDLETEVKDGVVTLRGSVASFGVRRIAELVVADVSGVVEVINQLVIDWESSVTDGELADKIKAILDNDIFVDTSFMDVKVENRTAFLSGRIGSVVGRNRAEQKAYVAGVSFVDGAKVEVVPGLRDSDQKKSKFITMSDETIKKIIEETFEMDPRINRFTPKVYVSKGYVTLKGTVNTLKAKESASRNAKNTTGVRQVFNFLKVRSPDLVTDEVIRSNIMEGLRLNPFTESHDLSVSVRNGRVSVEGVVESLYESGQVSAVTSGIAGVKEIRNYTTTKSVFTPGISGQFAAPVPTIRSIDTELEGDIEEEIKWNWFLDSSNVDVNVRNGMVTLEGEVDSLWEKERAENEAREAGANVIINQLKVK